MANGIFVQLTVSASTSTTIFTPVSDCHVKITTGEVASGTISSINGCIIFISGSANTYGNYEGYWAGGVPVTISLTSPSGSNSSLIGTLLEVN